MHLVFKCALHMTSFTLLFGRPFVKQFALCYRTIVLSVTLVYCGQTVGRIKMKLGTEVGLGPGHIVLNGDQLPQRSTAPSIFGPCLLWLNGCMDQDATWYGGTPRPRPHCIRWEPSSPQTKTPQQSIIQYTNKLLVY